MKFYTDAEVEAMGAAPPTEAAPPEREAVIREQPGMVKSAWEGFKAAPTRTLAGLNQVVSHLPGIGSPEKAAEANEIVRLIKEDVSPYTATTAGKIGGLAGEVAQIAALPAGAVATPLRAAATAGAFGLTQPVETLGTGDLEFASRKGGRALLDAVLAGAAGKVAKTLTREGIAIPPERAPAVAEAERMGLKLTPAQRTGNLGQSQYEEGLKSRPGSADVIAKVINQPQTKLNEAAARAIGQEAAAPTEAVLQRAAEKAAQGYQPMASIKKLSPDIQYITDIEKLAASQAMKASGSPDVAAVAQRLKNGAMSNKVTGNSFLEELQGVRDASVAARTKGDVNTSKQLRELSDIMENYAERQVGKLAKAGKVPADAMEQLRAARSEYAKIRAIEGATETVTGKVSPIKFLNQERKRQPASRGRGTSPLAEGTREVGDIARVMRETQPYIGSSGTAERIAGQQLVELSTASPLNPATWYKAAQMGKNNLAARLHLKGVGPFSGQAGMLGKRLTPGQNALARRMAPIAAVGATEELTQ